MIYILLLRRYKPFCHRRKDIILRLYKKLKGYLVMFQSPNTLLVSYIVLGLCLFNDDRKAYSP